jgi:ATP-dependent Lon protease
MITKNILPLIALRDVVLFPGMLAPIYVGRQKSVNAIEKAKSDNTPILLVTQKKSEEDDPNPSGLYNVGLRGNLTQIVKLPNNHLKILVDLTHKVKLSNISQKNDEYLEAEYNLIQDKEIDNIDELTLLSENLQIVFTEYARLNKKVNPEIVNSLSDQKNPSHVSNLIASHLTCKLPDKQNLLEISNVKKRIEQISWLIHQEITGIQTEQSIQQKVRKQIEKSQKDYYLNEQMKVIQKELGDGETTEITELEKKIKNTKLSKDAREKAENEFKKLKSMNPSASEAGVIRNYLETLLSLPWGKFDKSKIDVIKAEEVLNRDHFGLEKVKERILEYLSILQRADKIKGPIICFVGPPGVGKTSLVKSIAEAIGRKYSKFALGGIRDEAEIRGHRRTYLGSMPGKVINLIKKAKTSNPVILLDEIDKMSSDFRGDPASAMLEVLDPEQNIHFSDHYIEVEYDLSNVIFIATANSLNLPRPLLDRMEIIRISGYIEDEKLHIAKDHLLPKLLKQHNMKTSEFSISDDAILDIIRYYTRESGVRNLEREIANLIRKSLRKILSDKKLKSISINSEDLESYLGVRKFKFGVVEDENQVGVTTGLAYTEVGGDLLSIEAVLVPGKGEIKATGKLGDVMKESTQAAYSYFRSESNFLGIDSSLLKELDIHLHVPEGATPKDGPSAGTAIFTTICSLISGIPVKRDVAMTGEITLRGKVLPIGGLREKLLAANRGGIKTVIIPEENLKDLKEIPDSVKSGLNIIPVSDANQVLDIALESKIQRANA